MKRSRLLVRVDTRIYLTHLYHHILITQSLNLPLYIMIWKSNSFLWKLETQFNTQGEKSSLVPVCGAIVLRAGKSNGATVEHRTSPVNRAKSLDSSHELRESETAL